MNLFGFDPLVLSTAVVTLAIVLFAVACGGPSKTKSVNTPISSPNVTPKKQSPYQIKIEEAIEAARSEEKKRQAELSKRVMTGRTSTDGSSRY